MKLANTVKELIAAVAYAARLAFGDDTAVDSLDDHAAADTGGAEYVN